MFFSFKTAQMLQINGKQVVLPITNLKIVKFKLLFYKLLH